MIRYISILIVLFSTSVFAGKILQLKGELVSYNEETMKVKINGKPKRYPLHFMEEGTYYSRHKSLGKNIIIRVPASYTEK